MNSMPPPATPRRSNASRYLFMVLLGLAIGAVATVMIMRAIDQRRDPYPGAVMHLMAAHMGQMKQSVTQNRCAATDTLPHLQTLRLVSNDIETAFGDMRDDARFVQHAGDLRAALDASLASPPLNCQGVQAVMSKVGQTCESCHKYVHD